MQVVVRVQEHKVYQRKGADIYMAKQLTLLEALTGFVFELTYLDAQKFGIQMEEGEIISNGDIKQVHGKGLPFFKDAMGHGNLYVKFTVLFPKEGELTKQHMQQLKTILPNPNRPKCKATEIINLTPYDEHDLNENEEGGRSTPPISYISRALRRSGRSGRPAESVVSATVIIAKLNHYIIHIL